MSSCLVAAHLLLLLSVASWLVVGIRSMNIVSISPRTTSSSSHPPNPTGVYVHIPFCRRRCRYCNFAIVPVGPRGAAAANQDSNNNNNIMMMEKYTRAVIQEMKQTLVEGNISRIASVYFGGGTPSLASLHMLETLVDALKEMFLIEEDAEWTIEMDPGTFDLTKLQAIRDMGFNRISFGVQSFNDDILNCLGRQHDVADVYRSVDMLHRVYGNNLHYSMDLISGVPGLTLAMWCETLQKATALAPQHLSLYDLQIERGTVFDVWYGEDRAQMTPRKNAESLSLSQKSLVLPSEEDAAFMYRYAAGYLRSKGFEHYEVSSYAVRSHGPPSSPSPFRSRHNQIYWDARGQWYAFGLGATSLIGGRTLARPKALFDYHEWVERGVGDISTTRAVEVSKLDFCLDVVLKRLRTGDGLDLLWIHDEFGPEYVAAILEGAELGIELGLVSIRESNLRLKDPDGFLVSNSILSSIFLSLEALAPESKG